MEGKLSILMEHSPSPINILFLVSSEVHCQIQIRAGEIPTILIYFRSFNNFLILHSEVKTSTGMIVALAITSALTLVSTLACTYILWRLRRGSEKEPQNKNRVTPFEQDFRAKKEGNHDTVFYIFIACVYTNTLYTVSSVSANLHLTTSVPPVSNSYPSTVNRALPATSSNMVEMPVDINAISLQNIPIQSTSGYLSQGGRNGNQHNETGTSGDRQIPVGTKYRTPTEDHWGPLSPPQYSIS